MSRLPSLPILLAGICFALPLLVVAWAAVHGQDGHIVHLSRVLAGMSAAHPLGCDELGRDVLARLAEAIRLSLAIGVGVMVLAGALGIMLGITAGWLGGWADVILMRAADIVLSFPGILLAIAMAAMLGPSVQNIVYALVAVGWVGFARLARGQVLSLKSAPFIDASLVAGSGFGYQVWRHVLPNIAAPLLVEASFGLAAVIIGEAGLSFLGVGVQPPAASLGTMIREGTNLMLVAPSQVVWPGLMLFLLVMGVNILGDALRDRLDVRREV